MIPAISDLLRFAASERASDLHLSAGERPMVRIDGEMHRIDLSTLSSEEAHRLLFDVMNDAQRRAFQERLELDFAFVLDAKVPAGDVVRAALGADKKLIANVSVFDLFEGKALGPGKKSLALEVTLQPREKTLTDAEIEAVAQRIIAEVGKATGGQIRA